MKKDKAFEIVGTFEISIVIKARNRKEAKAFAEEELAFLVNVDTNELDGVLINYKKQTKRPKVKQLVEEQETQGETNEQ